MTETPTVALRRARTCYDHLAGQFGCWLTQELLDRQALLAFDGGTTGQRITVDRRAGPMTEQPYVLGPNATAIFGLLDVELALDGPSRRPLLRFCVDWTERRHHLAGALGARVLVTFEQAGWVTRIPGQRALILAERAERELTDRLRAP
ncbi:MAG: hypothetical protein ABI140_02260 [Jatrophihabitantaceae bacterium]